MIVVCPEARGTSAGLMKLPPLITSFILGAREQRRSCSAGLLLVYMPDVRHGVA